jgi:FAD/FMN-containing dehydrogenase
LAAIVTKQDPRFPVLRRGKNARFPATDADEVSRILVCQSAADAQQALQRVIDAGLRPTVRSGGHCYEDFVANNPGGAILDVSTMDQVTSAPGNNGPFQTGAGAMLGVIYSGLYRQFNRTVPGGSCYSVGAGGHLSGGGYGLLTRLQGLSVDWITGIDILTVEANGRVIPRHVTKAHDPDLFRALRGGGGSNFGLITSFYFDTLPPAPVALTGAGVTFPWSEMTEDRFIQIAQTYGHYFETRGRDKDTWPLFTYLGLNHKSGNGWIDVSATMHHMTDEVDLSVLTEFLDLFVRCDGGLSMINPPVNAHAAHQQEQNYRRPEMMPCIAGKHNFQTAPWIAATIADSGGVDVNGRTRGKYKSCYMKKNFTTEELRRMYKWLMVEATNTRTDLVVSVDSYGGATNSHAKGEETAVPQRDSIMKVQFQMYWQDPAEDAARLKYIDDFYTDVYSANEDKEHAGTPYHNEFYEGCYINYPDIDMLRYPFWPELYYGDKGLYPFLQSVKKRYDPNNVFHHSMAVRL